MKKSQEEPVITSEEKLEAAIDELLDELDPLLEASEKASKVSQDTMDLHFDI